MTPLSSLARLMGQTALLAFVLPAAAVAQQEDTVVLNEIVLKAGENGATGPVANRANPATLTGSKVAAKLTEIPQSVSVIGAEELDQMNVNKVDGALAYSAGVQTQPYGYDSDTNWFFVRGFAGTATGAFLDGLPSYSYGFGGFYIDPFELERIEVLRGPASALYGAANPGGIVNMVSKRPTGETGGKDELGVDESGRVWLSTDRQGVISDNLQYRFVAKAERTDDMGVFEPGSRFLLAPSLQYTTAGGTEITLGLSYDKIDEDHVGGAWLPYYGAVKDASATFGRIDRDFNSGEPGYDEYKRDQVMLSSEIAHSFDSGWRLVNNTRLGWSHLKESSVYAYGYAGYAMTPTDPDNTLSRIFFQHDTTARTVMNDLRLENDFATGGVQHRFMVGLDAKWFDMDQVQASVAWPDAATGLSASNPVYGAAQPDTTPYLDNIVRQTQIGLYLQDQIKWGNGWTATANLRHDIAETSVSDDRFTGAEGSSRRDGETTWRLGVTKEFAGGLAAYASASSYFNPQVVTTTAGNAISPETGNQKEIGLKWSPADTTLVTLSLFDIDREDISQSVWNGAGYDYYQIGKVNSRGVELEARHDFGNGLKLQAALTSMKVEVKDDVDTTLIGKTPYGTVEKMASVKVDYDLPSVPGLTLTAGVRHLGSSWADNANTLKVPSVTLVDAGVSYDFAPDWNANLAVTNLADKTYVAACQTGFSCFYGEGRRVSLAISHKF
ncbi:MAG: TonB-dependent siderophore receptor [Paracoccaceae bacterium]